MYVWCTENINNITHDTNVDLALCETTDVIVNIMFTGPLMTAHPFHKTRVMPIQTHTLCIHHLFTN
jgi:hypothetical protein